MATGKSVVITAYGHEKTIDKIAVSLFDRSESGYYRSYNESNAETYCDTINSLGLKGDSWVFAKIISENMPFSLDAFLPITFNLVLRLDDRSIQKVMREVDSQELAKALKGESEEVQERFFCNMSKNAAQMLKEDMEYMGPVRIKDVKEAQEMILAVIRHLEQTGEIDVSFSQGGTIE